MEILIMEGIFINLNLHHLKILGKVKNIIFDLTIRRALMQHTCKI